MHALPFEELNGIVDRISLLYDRHFSFVEPSHLLFDLSRELVCNLDASVHRAVKGISQGKLCFDMDIVAEIFHDVPDSFYKHHLSCADIGIVPGAVPCCYEGDRAVSLKSLAQLLHFSVKEDQSNGVVILFLVFFDDILKSCALVILLNSSLYCYCRHAVLLSWKICSS